MPISAALPGLLLAALAIAGPLWIRLPTPASVTQIGWFRGALPWLRSAGLLYLAIVAGWVSMRDAGLLGQTAEEWLAGGAVALILGAAGGVLAIRFRQEAPITVWIQDETRWTLYRAVAWPLAGFLPLAVPAAWLVAALEAWEECRLAGKSWNWKTAAPWLVRTVASAVLFTVAHNLYLAAGMYLLVWLIVRYQSYLSNFFRPMSTALSKARSKP
jgi:hypothetical protein